MRILFITNIPSPYRVDFFNELGKQCELTVCYERQSAGDRDVRWQSNDAIYYTAHFTKAKSFGYDKTIGFDLIKEIKRNSFDYLIITGYSSPSVMLAIIYCRLHHIPYILESDGGFYKSEQGLKFLLKKVLLCAAQVHLTTCEEHIAYLEKELKIPRVKIYKYSFTSLKNDDIAKEPSTNEEKLKLREELGITEQKVVLSVGQFIYRKGFDVLLNAAKQLSEDLGVYIIGSIPTAELINQKERLGLSNVHFMDFKQKEELKKWYRAADLFVLPTREDIWGLVINEAMAQGLPVITTNKCIAGLELVDDSNGKIVEVGCADEIAKSIYSILSDFDLMESMSKKSLEVIKKYTVENMAMEHVSICQNFQK